jgi:hypothetical protein
MADAAQANEGLFDADSASIGADYVKAKTQRFFAQLALEARKPSFGEQAAGWTRALLLRAQEAGLFDPTLENV